MVIQINHWMKTEPSKTLILLPFALGILCLGLALFVEMVGLLFFGIAKTIPNDPPLIFNFLGEAFLFSFRLGAFCVFIGIVSGAIKGLMMLYQKLEQSNTPPDPTDPPTQQPPSEAV